MTTKSKSRQRFEQLNHIIDEIIGKLPLSVHGLVLIVCWRHADQHGKFSLSHQRIADAMNISRRSAIRFMKALEKSGAIKRLKKGSGITPSKYQITGRVVPAVSPPEKHKPP